MSFFRTVFSLCSGTELFPKMLEKPSLFRAFFHLFLLLILCTAGVIVAAWLLNRDNVNLVCDRFIERTGGFEIKPDEIVIGKEKDRSRGYKLTETLRFDYFAKAGDCKEEALKEKKALYGIFCLPSGAVFWIRDPRHELPKYRLMVMPAHIVYSMTFQTINPNALLQIQKQSAETLYSPAEVCETVRKELSRKITTSANPEKGQKKTFKITEKLIAAQALAVMILFHVSAYLVEVVMALILVLVFFSLAQKFRFSGAPKKIPYKTILTMTVYAMFPAIIAATFFQMMQLYFLSFQTVFFIIFFIYQLFAFNRVFEFLYPRRSAPDEPDDDF